MEGAVACLTACVMDGRTLDIAASALPQMAARCADRAHMCFVLGSVQFTGGAKLIHLQRGVPRPNGILGGPGKEVSV